MKGERGDDALVPPDLAAAVKVPDADVPAQATRGQQARPGRVEGYAPWRARVAAEDADTLASANLERKIHILIFKHSINFSETQISTLDT